MPEIITRAEARAGGLKRFFTGKPCKHGHISERYVSDRCCATCEREGKRRYRATHPDHQAKATKRHCEWRKKNPIRLAAWRYQWAAKNREKLNKYAREWRANNPEKRREQERRARTKRVAAYRALRELGIQF